MGQKVHPTAFRLGITEEHRSRWFATKREFSELLVEDAKLRKFIKSERDSGGRPLYPAISKIEIERTSDEVKVVLHSARPGLIIGRKGEKVEILQSKLQDLIGRRINIKIEELSRPGVHAQLVAEDIAEQLAKRSSFRRTMKRALETTMEAGAKGIKIQLAGRLGGAEMARREKQIAGAMPLSTLRANIDHGFTEAKTPQGHIGVQVWINRGELGELEDGADAQAGQASKKPKRSYKR